MDDTSLARPHRLRRLREVRYHRRRVSGRAIPPRSMSSIPWFLTWLAAGATTLFAGGALYVSLVEHPARLLTGPPMAVAQFRTSYPRGARLQGSLAVLGGLAAIGAWLGGARIAW